MANPKTRCPQKGHGMSLELYDIDSVASSVAYACMYMGLVNDLNYCDINDSLAVQEMWDHNLGSC